MPADLKEQLPSIDRLVEQHDFPILRVKGYEADDVIGTLTVQAVNDPPVAENDSYTATVNTLLQQDAATGVLANDTDPDTDFLKQTTTRHAPNSSSRSHPGTANATRA